MTSLHLLRTSAIGLLLPVAALAQTPAATAVVPPCTIPATADSLTSPLTSNAVWKAGPTGLVVFEIESIAAANGWVEETTDPGFTGTSYFRWDGGDQPRPGQGELTYRVFVEQAGLYNLRIHNRHNNPDPSQGNDCWVRVNFNGWEKVFSNNGNGPVAQWNWLSQIIGQGSAQYLLPAGETVIQISGRSQGFQIDRVSLFPTGENGANTALPVSDLLRSRPVIGETFSVVAQDAGLGAGSSATLFWSPFQGPACGVFLPGFGELQLDLFVIEDLGTLSMGPNGAQFDIPLPLDTNLVGLTSSLQAAFVDPAGPSFSLSERLDISYGDF